MNISVTAMPNETLSFASCSSSFDTHGGIVLYLVVILIICIALGLICEHAFSSSILCICERLKLSDDVAGATLMAAGTSAPELFISLFSLRPPVPGELVSDAIGAGAIVGSAIFNLAVIIGLSLLASTSNSGEKKLNYKFLIRDVLCNLACVVFVVAVFSHSSIYWYHAVIALVLYALYVVLMKFNSRLLSLCSRLYARCSRRPLEDVIITESSDEEEEMDAELMEIGEAHLATEEDFMDSPIIGKRTLRKTLQNQMSSQVSAPLLEGIEPIDAVLADEDEFEGTLDGATASPRFKLWRNGIYYCTEGAVGWNPSYSMAKKVWVVLSAPFNILFYYTIPEADNPTWGGRLCWVSFFICLAYLGGITALLIHIVGKVGCLLHFSDSVTGATLLAVATSMPDCLTSVFMARKGYTSMAISNALGSNVFDVFIALGVPWLFASIIGWPVVVSGDGVLAYCIIFTVALIVFSICAIGFRCNVRIAWAAVLLATYALFLIYVGLDDAMLFPWSTE